MDDELETDNGERIAKTARRLALIGYVPFAAMVAWLAGIATDHPSYSFTLQFLTAYGAIILSFLGGARWGMEIHRSEGAGPWILIASMLPPLAAFAAFLLPVPYVYAMLAVAFAAQGAWDSFSSHSDQIPDWYGRMRITLTVLIVLTLILAFTVTT